MLYTCICTCVILIIIIITADSELSIVWSWSNANLRLVYTLISLYKTSSKRTIRKSREKFIWKYCQEWEEQSIKKFDWYWEMIEKLATVGEQRNIFTFIKNYGEASLWGRKSMRYYDDRRFISFTVAGSCLGPWS